MSARPGIARAVAAAKLREIADAVESGKIAAIRNLTWAWTSDDMQYELVLGESIKTCSVSGKVGK